MGHRAEAGGSAKAAFGCGRRIKGVKDENGGGTNASELEFIHKMETLT